MSTYEDLVYFQEKVSEDTKMIDTLMHELSLIDVTAATVASHGITEYGKEMMSSMYGDMIDLSSIKDLATSLEGLVNDIWEGIKKFFKSIWDSIINLLSRADTDNFEERLKKAREEGEAEGKTRAKDQFFDKAKLDARKDHFMKKADLQLLMTKTTILIDSISKLQQSKKFVIDKSLLGVSDSELKSMFAAKLTTQAKSKIVVLERLDPDVRDKRFQLQPDEVLFSSTGWEMNADLVDSMEEFTKKYKNDIVFDLEHSKMPMHMMQKDVAAAIEKLEKSSPDKQSMDAATSEQVAALKTFSENVAKILAICLASKFIIRKQLDLVMTTITFAKAK